MPTRSQPSKKALPESREALQRTLKSFERSAVLSARCTRIQPLSTTVKDRRVMDCRASKKAHPVSLARSAEQLAELLNGRSVRDSRVLQDLLRSGDLIGLPHQ